MSPTVDKALRQAQKFLNAGEFGEAELLYKQVLSKFPKNKKAIQGYQNLKAETTAVTSVNTEPPQEQLKELSSFYKQGRFEEVLSKVKLLICSYPKSIFLLNIQGAVNAILQKYDAAIGSYQQAIMVQPNFAEAYYNLGICLKHKADIDAAIGSYKQAIRINPHYAEAHNNMGNALRDKGDLNAAIESYKQAIKAKPDYAEAFNNMGLLLIKKGGPDTAIESYKQAIKINPHHAEAHNNIGNALRDKGDLNAAIESYKQAIKINPHYAEAYYNMGNSLKDKDDLNAAIESYKQAIKINPHYADPYNNMGVALMDKGDLDAAIDSYKRVLKIKSDYAGAWNNLLFPLQATKLQAVSGRDLLLMLGEQAICNYSQIAKSILSYLLHLGGPSTDSHLNEALRLLSSAHGNVIKNPKMPSDELIKGITFPKKITALVHFGRSGTGLLHSLIDGHPEISTLPSIYFSEFFDHSTWKELIAGGWDEIAESFITTYPVLFDASSPKSVRRKSGKSIKSIGVKEGMANVGKERNEVLQVDENVFRDELKRLIGYFEQLDAFTFFNLAHSAYDVALNDLNKKSLIFYHIHNPGTYSLLNFSRSASNSNWVMMVREPVQSCESWVQSDFHDNDYKAIAHKIFQMLFEVDHAIFQNENSIGIRLEDLKEHPTKTIPALCNWMGIKEEDSLYQMTAQGKKWWGDLASPDFAKDGMKPFGKTSINRKLGSVFSKKDQFILRTLFYPFSVHFGYAEENSEQFKVDLQTIRPMIDQMFNFERNIAQYKKISKGKFIKTVSYLYLRSGMIERWNTLNKFHTYPNMITPLKIN